LNYRSAERFIKLYYLPANFSASFLPIVGPFSARLIRAADARSIDAVRAMALSMLFVFRFPIKNMLRKLHHHTSFWISCQRRARDKKTSALCSAKALGTKEGMFPLPPNIRQTFPSIMRCTVTYTLYVQRKHWEQRRGCSRFHRTYNVHVPAVANITTYIVFRQVYNFCGKILN